MPKPYCNTQLLDDLQWAHTRAIANFPLGTVNESEWDTIRSEFQIDLDCISPFRNGPIDRLWGVGHVCDVVKRTTSWK